MEIGPISGIRPALAMKPPEDDSPLSAIFDIEGSSEASDDTFTRSDRNAAGGQDDASVCAEEAAETIGETSIDDTGSTINLLA